MPTDDAHQQALIDAIGALERQRDALGDGVVDAALAPLRRQLQATPAEPERRLRQVSVLFLDLVGSTQLIQHLDPEDAQSVVDGALAAFTAIVQRHGGEVLRYAGDNIKAAFGVNGTHEDDAERAVLCGLALLQEAARRGEAVRREHGHEGFDARVGIHTGPVVLGGGIEKDKSLSGLAVNIAARLEQAAPTGMLRVSQDTWALVRGVFDADAQPPLAVKGHDAPIVSWLVRGSKPRAFRLVARGIEGLETALVGRRTELAQLDAAFEGLLADRAPCALTLIAEAGLGKSRLLHEFQHRLSAHAATCWLLLARSQPSGGLQPYGLLRDMVSRRLRIADSDSAEVAKAKLIAGLAPWLAQPDDPAPEPLGQLIGLDFSGTPALVRLGTDASLLRDRGLAALRVWLERLSASDGSPVVLLLDDLQWSDDASLDALAVLLKRATLPLLAVVCARPGLIERRPDWGEGLPQHRRLTLQALDEQEQGELSAALLQRLDEVPVLLSTLIRQRAEGNPFYAEELVKMLLDHEVIETREGRWHFHAARLQPGRLPTTLTGVLQARIDALAPEARTALQLASVIGPVFWDEALGALDDGAPASLPMLQARAMVQARPTSVFEDTVEEAFHHHLLHQVSYDTVLKEQRRQAHARVAAWLTARVGGRSDEYLAIAAEHHARAGQHAQAADWFERAATLGARRYASRQALHFIDRALAEAALAPEPCPAERLFELEWLRCNCSVHLGLSDDQSQVLDRMLALGEAHDRQDWLARTLAARTLWAYRRGMLAEAEAVARRGAEVAIAADHATSAALCTGNLAYMHLERREFEAAHRHLAQAQHWAGLARERMQMPGDDIYVMQMLLVENHLHAAENRPAAAADASRRAVAAMEGADRPLAQVNCRGTLVTDAFVRGDLAQATEHLEIAERLVREYELHVLLSMTRRSRVFLYLLQERWAEAAEESAAAVIAARAVANPVDALKGRAHQAEVAWRSGRSDDAVAIWQEMVSTCEQLGETGRSHAPRLRLADARAASGQPEDVAAARLAVLDVLAAEAQGSAIRGPYREAARLAAWRVLRRAGDPAAAGQLALAANELDQVLSAFDDRDVRERIVRVMPWHREVLEALGLMPSAVRNAAWLSAAGVG
ncbi:ATP-binding protein [Roseateles sp. LYH14W]|uniref:ATP-binding protein n=1 Tax=Pelomonas parva TaxID=3299032 RepID=A0ABW7F598_9BURK